MPRSIRIEYEGAFYHVMARGNRQEAIFVDDEDRWIFLRTLGEVCCQCEPAARRIDLKKIRKNLPKPLLECLNEAQA